MSAKVSAGLLMYRLTNDCLEVLLAHPGGPLYEGQDTGCWGIPKGEVEAGETVLAAAIREFTEETGLCAPTSYLLPLGTVTEPSGKVIHAWAFPGDCDTTQQVASNLFALEWPKGSGQIQLFPEVNKLDFCSLDRARQFIETPQTAFIVRLALILADGLKTA